MELRTLQYFLVVAQEENISKAAEVLHITQPTLSRQMRNLEEELDTTLFIRGKNFTLTSAGLLLKNRAEEIISLTEKTASDFERVNEMIGGTITIGSAAIGNKSILTDLITKFREKFPKVSFNLITGTRPEIIEDINNGLVDIGLVIGQVAEREENRFHTKQLSHVEEWGVIMHKDSPLSQKERISKEDLKNLTVGYSNRVDSQKMLSKHLEIDITTLDTIATYNLISNSIGLAEKNKAHLLSIVSVMSEGNKEELTYRLFEPHLETSILFIWKKDKVFNDATEKFLEFLRDEEI